MARRVSTILSLLAALVLLAAAPGADARIPKRFFGVVPQTHLELADTKRMRHGGVDIVRVAVEWRSIQPSPDSAYVWSAFDHVVTVAARAHLEVLPFVYGTPGWIAGRYTNLPVANARQRRAWSAFLRAAVHRYRPGGDFWREHGPFSGSFVPRHPIRKWQVWNEENFFYFTTPASPARYARLLKISSRAIKGAHRRAEVIVGGLFGDPKQRPPRAMDAADFLDRLYRVRGIKRFFDGVALHPYAADVRRLRRLTEGIRRTVRRNRDPRTGLYITEMGWGSQRSRVSFEVGRRAQARALRGSYRYLIRNRRRLNLKQVHWFTWKDIKGSCSFCDSTGLFRRGPRFKPKPAWHMFARATRGRLGG